MFLWLPDNGVLSTFRGSKGFLPGGSIDGSRRGFDRLDGVPPGDTVTTTVDGTTSTPLPPYVGYRMDKWGGDADGCTIVGRVTPILAPSGLPGEGACSGDFRVRVSALTWIRIADGWVVFRATDATWTLGGQTGCFFRSGFYTLFGETPMAVGGRNATPRTARVAVLPEAPPTRDVAR